MEADFRSNGRRIAFFGGTFDPPHFGHLAIARAARMALRLDTVLFAPVGCQPLKPQGSTAGFEDRLAMTELAIAGDSGFELSLADAPKTSGEPNFTADTLEGLRASLLPEDKLFCLMGADSFFSLRHWHRSSEIPFLAPLIIASRPRQGPEEWITGIREALPPGLSFKVDVCEGAPSSSLAVHRYLIRNAFGESAPLYLLSGLEFDISASQIRDGVRSNIHASGDGLALLPRLVFDYIRANGLYR